MVCGRRKYTRKGHSPASIAQLIVGFNLLRQAHPSCKCCNYSSPRRNSTKPIRFSVALGVAKAPMHSDGSWPRHRPGEFMITMHRKNLNLHDGWKCTNFSSTRQNSTKPSVGGVANDVQMAPAHSAGSRLTPQAMKSAIANGYHGALNRLKNKLRRVRRFGANERNHSCM